MDLNNNKKGRAMGRYYEGEKNAGASARGSCKSAVSTGKLWIIKSGRLVRSNA